MRVLYSFPHKIGAGRICDTAWHQVAGLAEEGVDVIAAPASVQRELPPAVRVEPTMARGKFRIPFRLVGQHRALAVHDRIVARRLPRLAGQIDLVHTWPLGALETLRAAKALGIPTVLERPNTHTRFAYQVVRAECERIGVPLPPDHEHAYNEDVLRKEETEYELADALLCPSDFVLQTFVDEGVPREKLVRHIYGFDERRFHPPAVPPNGGHPFTALIVGVAAVRKGLHLALEAWLASPASKEGRFLVVGAILPAYEQKLGPLLSHSSVHVLGHREDVADLMRASDVLVLPSLEEGSALACSEALGSGCVALVSDATSGVCANGVDSLVHRAGDVAALTDHITAVFRDRTLLDRLRNGALSRSQSFTWEAAGRRLAVAYEEALAR
jgi:glycosyltransferase involved in cell wall biosynthesis